jgi:uncharacterized membrane protein YcaP (DUF421 family)
MVDVLGSLNGQTEPGQSIGLIEMCLRAALVYGAVLVMVRLGHKRFLGRSTAFDIVLGIILGSVVSRAITGNAPFLPALAAGLSLILLHSAFSALAIRSAIFARLITGRARVLIRAGELDADQLRRARISEEDLREALRLSAGIEELEKVQSARLERNGEISVVKKEPGP